MDGRNGNDELNRFLNMITIVMLLISMFFGVRILFYAAVVLLIFTFYRSFSRNLDRREEENDRFLDFKDSIARKADGRKRKTQDRTHRYFRCPNCHKSLRVPRGKGKISIHCPQCGTDFIKRS